MKKNELEKSQELIQKLKQQLNKKEIECLSLEGQLNCLKTTVFNYENVSSDKSSFEYLCGLTVEKFDLIMNCLRPYVHLIPYPDNHKVSWKLFDMETQLLITLTICRHALDLKFMAFLVKKSETTIQRIFIGWIIFIAAVFNRIDLIPGHGFLLKKMPKSFIKTGHGMTDLVIDATEFKFQCATNYDLNTLMFSHYKNTQTGKALIGISPHGMGILFSDIYPGSISDSEITDKSDILSFVRKDHELMSDRGFAVQELCSVKGIYLNRPKQKDCDQFTENEVQKNFDIASTRIHVERYIGRVRDWRILNRVWNINQLDLLGSVWQTLCHIVNLTMEPIGPKE